MLTASACDLYLERLRQLCSTGVARVHGDEGHDCRLQCDLNVLKHKALLASTQRIQHSLHDKRNIAGPRAKKPQCCRRQMLLTLCLRVVQKCFTSKSTQCGGAAGVRVVRYLVLRGADRQHCHRNAVELIKTSPGTSLGETLVNLPHGLVVHLVRAVENIALHSQRACQILGRLSFASSCISGTDMLFDCLGRV